MPLAKISDSFAQCLGTDCASLICSTIAFASTQSSTLASRDIHTRYNQLIPGIVMLGAFLQAKILATPLLVKLGTE